MTTSRIIPDELLELRRAIDEIDKAILALVAQRRSCSQRVGEVKKNHQIASLRDAAREYEIVTRLSHEGLSLGIPTTLTQAIFGALISDSLSRQEQDILRSTTPEGAVMRRRIGYVRRDGVWGEQAAASCAALHKVVGEEKRSSIVRWETITEALEALEDESTDLLMLPLEHSTLGTLRESVIALTESSLRIIRDIRVPVSLTLMAPAGVSLNQIRRIYGSELAFRLCSSLLDTLSPITKEIAPILDPQWLASEGISCNDWALIAPEHVAITSGLTVLATAVADVPTTTLRFIACSTTREPINPQLSYATSLITVTSQQSGALSAILEVFRRHNIVLTKLESLGAEFAHYQLGRQLPGRVRQGTVWTEQVTARMADPLQTSEEFFLIECIGAETHPPLATALAELSSIGSHPHVLGSYPRTSAPPEPGVIEG